jgi:hypothetical protein
MAIWHFRLVLIPELILRRRYGTIPDKIPREAVDFPWRSQIAPQQGFEQWIDSFVPSLEPWPDMRRWGFEHGNRVSVCYVEGSSTKVEEIGITIDARHAPEELLEAFGNLASKLGCVFLTVHTGEIVQPDKSSLLRALKASTANRFLSDPETTLKGLDCGVLEIDFEPKN